jgi:hypothetical protein
METIGRMKKKIIAILFCIIFLAPSCAPAKPSWDRTQPDTLFEAVNVKDNKKVTEFDKGLMKFLSMGTVIWLLHVLTTR